MKHAERHPFKMVWLCHANVPAHFKESKMSLSFICVSIDEIRFFPLSRALASTVLNASGTKASVLNGLQVSQRKRAMHTYTLHTRVNGGVRENKNRTCFTSATTNSIHCSYKQWYWINGIKEAKAAPFVRLLRFHYKSKRSCPSHSSSSIFCFALLSHRCCWVFSLALVVW